MDCNLVGTKTQTGALSDQRSALIPVLIKRSPNNYPSLDRSILNRMGAAAQTAGGGGAVRGGGVRKNPKEKA